MIKTIKFKFGTHQTQAPLSMDVTPITVFVGPNNSGKSKVLVEIENYCRRTRPQANDVILNQLEFVQQFTVNYKSPKIKGSDLCLSQCSCLPFLVKQQFDLR